MDDASAPELREPSGEASVRGDASAASRNGPRVVVAPFGVSDEESVGYGIAIAALIHGFVLIDGESPALARVLAVSPKNVQNPEIAEANTATETEEKPVEAARVLETELAPWHWAKVAPAGGDHVRFVITGYFEPPTSGRGLLRATLFDPSTERVLKTAEADCDEDDCGSAIAEIAKKLSEVLGSGVSPECPLEDLRGLSWEALSDLLRGEVLLLPELPTRSVRASAGVTNEETRDPQLAPLSALSAALLHFGRAVSEAPEAAFPARRLAAVVTSLLAPSSGSDPALHAAARRAVLRSMQDAPKRPELCEVAVAAALSEGDLVGAEARTLTGIARFPENTRFRRYLVEIRRERGDLEGAQEALVEATQDPHFSNDLGLRFEGARIALAGGDRATARRIAGEVAALLPNDFGPPLFLADVIDATAEAGESVEDEVRNFGDVLRANEFASRPRATAEFASHPRANEFASRPVWDPPPVLLRRAIVLHLRHLSPGADRGARLLALAARYRQANPRDPEGHLVAAKAAREAGDAAAVDAAIEALDRVAPGSPLAAEARAERFGVRSEEAAATLDRIAEKASNTELTPSDLEVLQLQSLHLAREFEAWPAYHLAGLLAARIGLVDPALAAFEAGLALAPGALPILGATARFALQQLEQAAAPHGEASPDSDLLTRASAAIDTLARFFPGDGAVFTLQARRALLRREPALVDRYIAAARAIDPEIALGKALEGYLAQKSGTGGATARETAPPPSFADRIKRWFS